MTRDMNFSSLKRSLTVLGVDVSDVRKKCPNYTVVRKAYRKLLMSHPDKGGNTLEFQRVTEAFSDIMDYMRNNPDNIEDQEVSEVKEEEEDTKLRKVFENANNVKYNENTTATSGGNITFSIKKEEAKQWVNSLDAYFDKVVKKQLPCGGWQYVDKSWQIPGKSDSAASLFVIVWPDSKDPSVMVQGKHHIPFVALVLPKIAMSIGKKEDEIRAIMDKQDYSEVLVLAVKDPLKDASGETDPSKEKALEKSVVTEERKSLTEKVLEKEDESSQEKVIEEDTEPEKEDPKTDKKKKKKDLSVKEKEPPSNSELLKEKKSTDDKASKEKRTDLEEVGFTINRLEKGMEKRFQDLVNTLASSLEIQKKGEAKVAELSEQVKSMNSKVEEVLVKVDKVDITTTETIKIVTENKDLLHLEEGWKKQREKVDSLLTTVLKMEKQMKNMINIVSKHTTKEPSEEVEAVEKAEDVETKRAGIMFSSSVAMPLKLKNLEEATDSKIDRVKTYRILDKSSAKDPDFHLSNMVKTHAKKEHEFSILVVGSNDIDDAVESKEDVVEKMEKQAERLVTVAAALVSDYTMEVFISEMIPRPDDSEGEVSKAELSIMANSFMKAKVAKVPHSTAQHLHVVRHSNLARPKGVERDKIFKDEKHLTTFGLKQFNNNLINAMSKVFKDIKAKEDSFEKPTVAKQTAPKLPLKKADLPQYVQEKQEYQRQNGQHYGKKYQGGHYNGKQYQGGQHQGGHHYSGQYQGGQHQDGNHYGGQLQGGPYQGGQHKGDQHQGGQYQGGQYQGGQHQGDHHQGGQLQGNQHQGGQHQNKGGQYQGGQHTPSPIGYWGPPSCPPPSPCPPPPPTPQHHWGQAQGHYSQAGQGGQYHCTSGSY